MVGGITRLTHSGLSISEWKPITGSLPPLNEVEWNNEFQLYKTTPEFKIKNSHFNLTQFKSIYWWEYIHRTLGRVLGLLFLFPFLFLIRKNKLKKKLKQRLIILFLLGCLQASIGWLMVKSGLQKNPQVSHLRLATHLTMAFSIVAYILWIIFCLSHKHKSHHPIKIKMRLPMMVLLILFFLQIIYGALVAGLKAGYLFGTFPTMGDAWVDDSIFWAYRENGLSSLVNFAASVQFIHRVLGFLIFIIILWLFLKIIKLDNAPKRLRKMLYLLFFLILIQVVLGIATILMHVPTSLALTHQFTALICFAVLIYTLHICYYSKNYHSCH